jgi:LmbE family N-acetylglucosaminyl deacetylase
MTTLFSPRCRSFFMATTSLLAVSVILSAAIWAGSRTDSAREGAQINSNAMPIDLDRGASGLSRYLAAIRTRASMLMVTAHPDDEDGGMLAYETRGLGARGMLLTLNRGEGGQNAMSADLYDALGLVRTQELMTADRYYGVDQYWTRVIDYGFSKTREEALEKWGYDRVLSDVVRVVRMTRPLVITAVFAGAPTDGHGNHQVSGQMAQEAYLAAGDPSRFPEQIREGLRPWQPLKVYARVPFFEPTKTHTIYDYATDKYVPIRFFNYVTKTWITERPGTNVTAPEGTADYAAGLTFQQIGRYGWGFQKSQNGGGTIPQPALYSAPYHRYASQVPAAEKENSFYDGIDISLVGIASLASGDTGLLKSELEHLSQIAETASDQYRAANPSAIAPMLADGLRTTRTLIQHVEASNLAEPGKNDVLFELRAKENQFEKALALALGLSFDAVVAPDRASTGPFAAFRGGSQTFTIAIPGQSFAVETYLLNESPHPVRIESINLRPAYEKPWKIKLEKSGPAELAGGKDVRLRFSVTAPEDANLTKAYFWRPDEEQPYYNISDERFLTLSLPPYPLSASVRVNYQGADFEISKVVQTNQRIEGTGMVQQPLLMAPPISVWVSRASGAVPLTASSFAFTCTLHSNVKGPARGVLRLSLPANWKSTPPECPFSFARDGENEDMTFQVKPQSLQERDYEIKAIAEYQSKAYEQGYRLVGYPGVRPYPHYRPAEYKAVGVNVKTAPDLRVGFFPGTGDDVPRALEDLGLHPQILSAGDLQSENLSQFNAIVLGVRAYAVRPDLRAANNRLLDYVKNGGVLIVQYNLQNFDGDYGPYPFSLGENPQKVVDEGSAVRLIDPQSPALIWPNKITAADFHGWQEERGHGFMEKWDPRYKPLVETHDPNQNPQAGGLLLAHYGHGIYVYEAFALYRQLPAGVPGAYRILANLVSLGKNPSWK